MSKADVVVKAITEKALSSMREELEWEKKGSRKETEHRRRFGWKSVIESDKLVGGDWGNLVCCKLLERF